MIDFEQVSVKYGDFLAIPNFDLTIDEGSFFTFLGPSGCGKTTALRTLAGFVPPSSGKIIIGGKDVTLLPSDQRELGMVFQNYALFPSLNVSDNIAFGLQVAKIDKKEIANRVREIAEQVELSKDQLVKGVAELSGGQQQRVAIARAMIMRPKILLLDEPLSNLDAKLRNQMRVQLKELQSSFGVTTVYVTHDQDEALSMSDQIAVINNGRIEQAGTPEEIYTESKTEFVCNFIGDVNRLDSSLTAQVADYGVSLDRNLPSYIRIEKVRLLPEGETGSGVRLSGTVVSKRYHGLHSSYQVAVGDQLIKAHILEDGASISFAVAEAVQVVFDPQFLRQYRPEAEVD